MLELLTDGFIDQWWQHVELWDVTVYSSSVLGAARHTSSCVITESALAGVYVCLSECVRISGVLLFTVYLYHPICAMFGLHPSVVKRD